MPWLLISLPFSLASSGPLPDPASAQSIGWLILAIAAAAAGTNQILSLVNNIRGINKPTAAGITKDRADAIEKRVRELELKMENVMGRIDSKFESISQTLTNLQSDWNYAIGKLDGRHESDR